MFFFESIKGSNLCTFILKLLQFLGYKGVNCTTYEPFSCFNENNEDLCQNSGFCNIENSGKYDLFHFW